MSCLRGGCLLARPVHVVSERKALMSLCGQSSLTLHRGCVRSCSAQYFTGTSHSVLTVSQRGNQSLKVKKVAGVSSKSILFAIAAVEPGVVVFVLSWATQHHPCIPLKMLCLVFIVVANWGIKFHSITFSHIEICRLSWLCNYSRKWWLFTSFLRECSIVYHSAWGAFRSTVSKWTLTGYS